MANAASKVICPHCGEQNPRSLIVTTCHKCLGSLEGAQPVAAEATPLAVAEEGAAHEPEAEVAEAAVEAETREPEPPPVRTPVMPPKPQEPPPVPLPPLPEPSPVAAKLPPLPPAVQPARPAAPALAPESPDIDAVRRELVRSLRSVVGARGRSPGQEQRVLWATIIGVAVVVMIAVSVMGGESFLPRLIVILVAAAGTFVVVRAIAAATTCEVTADPQPRGVVLGSPLTWGVTVRAKKPFDLGPGRIVLECQEHAIRRGGKNTTRHRKTIHTETQPFAARHLEAGETAELRAGLSIPPAGIPSHQGRNNSIEWHLRVEAAVPGICPNIKEEIQLGVLPRIAPAADRASEHAELVPADWLARAAREVRLGAVREGPLSAMVWPADGDVPEAVSAVSAGTSQEFNVTLQAAEDINCRGIGCWVGCRIHGRGTEEKVAVATDVPVHEGALPAGRSVTSPISVRIPAEGPVSYHGSYVNFDWVVQVNVDMPLWFDKHVEVPFVVTPRLAEE